MWVQPETATCPTAGGRGGHVEYPSALITGCNDEPRGEGANDMGCLPYSINAKISFFDYFDNFKITTPSPLVLIHFSLKNVRFWLFSILSPPNISGPTLELHIHTCQWTRLRFRKARSLLNQYTFAEGISSILFSLTKPRPKSYLGGLTPPYSPPVDIGLWHTLVSNKRNILASYVIRKVVTENNSVSLIVYVQNIKTHYSHYWYKLQITAQFEFFLKKFGGGSESMDP